MDPDKTPDQGPGTLDSLAAADSHRLEDADGAVASFTRTRPYLHRVSICVSKNLPSSPPSSLLPLL